MKLLSDPIFSERESTTADQATALRRELLPLGWLLQFRWSITQDVLYKQQGEK